MLTKEGMRTSLNWRNAFYLRQNEIFFIAEVQGIVNDSTLRPLSHRNEIGDRFGDPTTVTV